MMIFSSYVNITGMNESRTMPTIPIEEAQTRLAELIAQLRPGEEMILTRDQKPLARLIREAPPEEPPRRQLGTLQGSGRYLAPDFDAPLEEFRER
jgi:antitoxin (DNA-binding transcriptional repressor) of toxin-antitoxin stability system